MAQVQLALSEKELDHAMHGIEAVHQMPPHMFLKLGIDLEDKQYVDTLSDNYVSKHVIGWGLGKQLTAKNPV